MHPVKAPICPYCGAVSKIVDSAALYGGISYGFVWLCAPCHAYVGCHPGSKMPLGRLADAKLRTLKMRTHAVFDPFWMASLARLKEQMGDKLPRDAKSKARNDCYAQLAQALGIDKHVCHIGMFDAWQCRAAISVCHQWAAEQNRKQP